MKSPNTPWRLTLASGLLLALSACGGYTDITLGGSVTGLTTNGLTLANGSQSVSVPANATSYTFPNRIGVSDSFAVTITSQPARLTCNLTNPSGKASGIDVDYVNVTCTPNTYTLSGAVSGLTTSGLVLTNGSDTVTVAANATGFTFPTKVADGSPYGVAILSQPAGQTCTVTNGTAVMGAGDVSNVQVSCS